MNDATAGSSPGAQRGPSGPWGGGSPPPVLLAAMGAALLIAVTLAAFFIGSSSGNENLAPVGSANGGSSADGASEDRVRLKITIDGSGGGQIKVAPAGISCSETCSNDIVADTRVRVTADADIGSTFTGWSESCDGKGSCVFYMDRSRDLGVTFDKTGTATAKGPDCDNDGIPDRDDPGSCDDPPPAPVGGSTPASPASDCQDGKDNDGDGLTDDAQDPGCEFGSEAATSKEDADPDDLTAPPPPPAAPKDCADGKDNDGDGLIDDAQDPGCDKHGTEADD